MLRYKFFIKNGSYVQTSTQDWKLADASQITVENGGILDFGFSGTTALHVIETTSSALTTFTNQSGGTLKITSPNGITTSSTSGNVRTDTRTYAADATYHYIGKANQVTGDGLPTGGSSAGGKRVIAELNTTSLTLVPTAITNIGNGDTLVIRQGIVDETAALYFQAESGESGNLKMTGGTYRLEATGATVPQIVGENSAYQLTGGTIELDGATAQLLRGARTYHALTSVTNNTKTLTGGNVTVNSLLTLTNGVVTTGSHTVVMPAGSSVARTNGWVHGNLQKHFGTGTNVAQAYEIGDAATYAPIGVTVASVSGAGNVTAFTTSGDHASIGTSKFVATKTVNRTWTLANSGMAFTSYSVVPTWAAGDQDAAFTYAKAYGGHYDGSTWTYPTPSNRNATDLTLSGISSFGASGCGFQVGSCPVTLTASARVDDPCLQGIGSVTLTATEGTPPYEITWPQAGGSPASGVSLTNDGDSVTITGLTGGVTYEFTVEDAEGCTN